MSLKTRELFILAFLVIIAVLLSVFACTLVPGANAYPLMIMALYLFSPLPLFLCGQQREELFTDGGGANLANIAHFLFGVFFASGPALAFVLFHLGTMGLGALLLSLSSFVFLCGSIAAGVKFSKNNSDDF